jgi:hypothetical protein
LIDIKTTKSSPADYARSLGGEHGLESTRGRTMDKD